MADRDLGVRVRAEDVADYDPSRLFALVIGVNEYEHFQPLRCAVADAREFARTLTECCGFPDDEEHVRLRLDSRATKDLLVDELNGLLEDLGSEDSLLIYYAGHGWQHPTSGVGYWIPPEARENRISSYLSNSVLLSDFVSHMKARHITIISDSCFAGTLFRGAAAPVETRLPEYYKRAFGKPSRIVLTSGDLQPVADEGGGEHSLFNLKLCQLLRYGDREVYSPSDLWTSLREELAEWSSGQSLRYGPLRDPCHSGGEFVFCRTVAVAPGEEKSPEVEAPHPPPLPEVVWFAATRGGAHAEVPEAEMADRIAGGEITRETRVWKDGMAGWRAAGGVAELAAFFPPVAPPPLPAAPKAPPEPRKKPTASPKPAIVLPDGWTSEERRVVVATPEGDVEKEIAYYRNTLGMEFVLVPAGEFMMGSPEDEEGRLDREGPVHKVRITRPFFLGATPVTQAAYEQVTGGNPSSSKGPNRPVEEVSWNDAQAFIKKLCGSDGGDCRLPTEAEWEYACRAESRTRFYGGDAVSALGRIAWYDGNSDGETHDVAGKLPNAFGLYDMSGNVYDWCQSLFQDYPYKADDGREDLSSGGSRVLRGGSWNRVARLCRSANRFNHDPPFTYVIVGFRVVSRLPPQDGETTEAGRSAPAHGIPRVSVRETSGPGIAKPTPEPDRPGRAALPQGWTSGERRVLVATPEGDVEKDIAYYRNTLGMEFVLVQPGAFVSTRTRESSEGKRNIREKYRVRITRPFYMGAHPVTVEAFRRFVDATGYLTDAERGDAFRKWAREWKENQWVHSPDLTWRNPGHRQGRTSPVVCISWGDAMELAKWLSGKEGIEYSLPTEAEWEYACRAGTGAEYYWGNEFRTDCAWVGTNSGRRPHSVGSKRPNAFGLFDMSGNVWEWCRDWYSAQHAPSRTDPQGPSSGEARVIRGASWWNAANNCTCRNRFMQPPSLACVLGGARLKAV